MKHQGGQCENVTMYETVCGYYMQEKRKARVCKNQ